MLGEHDLVFEAVGRTTAWEQAVAAARPGGTVVLVGGCPGGTTVALETGPLHYDEVDVRGAFHHTRAEVDRALALLGAGDVDWRALAGPVDRPGRAGRRPAGAGRRRGAQARGGPGAMRRGLAFALGGHR